MTLDHSPLAANGREILPRAVPLFSVVTHEVILDLGTTVEAVHDDAVVNESTSATVRHDGEIIADGFYESVFQCRTPANGWCNRLGYVTALASGTAEVIVETGPDRQIVPVPVSIETPTDTATWVSWVPGSYADFLLTRNDELTDGVTASDATRKLFTTGTTRNGALFCADYAQALTGVAHSVNGSAHLGLTLITPRHAAGCAHVPFTNGSTAQFVDADGETVSRILTHSYHLTDTDTVIYLLDADVPIEFSPVAVLPPDVLDYLRNVQYRVPALFIDRDNKANVGDLVMLNGGRASIGQPPSGSNRLPFYTLPVLGTSGKPVLLPFSESELALCMTFHQPTGGPSYHSRDWSTVIAAVDALAGIDTGYLPGVADLSEFTNFNDPISVLPMTMLLRPDRGLYTDAGRTVQAVNDGDLIYHWWDNVRDVGVSQPTSGKRFVLRVSGGKRWIDASGGKFMEGNLAVSGAHAWAASCMLTADALANGRVLSLASASGFDFDGTDGIAAILRPGSSSSLGVQFAGSHVVQTVEVDEWHVFAGRTTGSELQSWNDGVNKQTAAVSTAIAATRVRIGLSYAFSEDADLWNGPIQTVAIGPWSEAQTVEVSTILQSSVPE